MNYREEDMKNLWSEIRAAIRRYFTAGLLAFAPIGITLWAIVWIIQQLDNLLLPKVLGWFGPVVGDPSDLPPLVGAGFTFLVILLAGVVVRHLFGNEVLRLGERLLGRVPVARSIYYGVKQLFEAIFSSPASEKSFSRVVLVEYPRKGIWGIAFVTGAVRGPVAEPFNGEPMLNCFIPTTPNPTSGFYLLVPEDQALEVEISVEDAFKVIMSAGLVTPTTSGQQASLPGIAD
ncbi:MAG: DUF502 domain-containing protein [Myxococcota bacterium]|jgi:uncharacterized membrane protein|nr:DUF502 domain-containing protein [Myxococcota bacterium]